MYARSARRPLLQKSGCGGGQVSSERRETELGEIITNFEELHLVSRKCQNDLPANHSG
jgi:hypothetical protein